MMQPPKPLSQQEMMACAIILAKKGTIASILWERMTGPQKYAVFETARRIMLIGVPGIGMGASVADIDTLALAREFVPPPGATDPAPVPENRKLDDGEAERWADWIVACAEASVPAEVSSDDQRTIMQTAGQAMIEWTPLKTGRTLK